MPRIRTIKPSFWADPSVTDMPWDARLFLIGLISLADDRGRFIATQSTITGYLFPHEDVPPSKFKRLMKIVEGSGIVQFYEVEGRAYGLFPKWASHQKISHPQPSTVPVPEAFHE